MTVYDVPVTEIEWTTWWMLGSAVLAFIGFAGWQLGTFFVGARVIAERDAAAPKYSWIAEKLLPGYLANKSFKRDVAGRHLKSGPGRIFFNLMLLGLGLHIGFWVYAANFMNQ
ncbi:hypothetical protein [Pelagibacterium xiamenense]|uniref:hypothetical protein n=1 Tax=Pelagibacterium xiamenense TaxID=2901140 RepID=UPI001E5DE189|nr:hypothetical protein [Pelagibacterium xiamenense]MCD7058636.1 hypothetical protein [Pelagibacterium xiamenense]